MNLILCGMPMSGKTTVGQKLAHRLAWDFVDTDRLIENATGRPCRELYQENGEATFRAVEKEQIALLRGLKASVIAVGGDSLLDEENVEVLRSVGRLIYLRAPVELLWERIKWRGIPAYADSERSFCELVNARSARFEAMANITFDVGVLSVDEIVSSLAGLKGQSWGRVWHIPFGPLSDGI